MLTRKCQLVLRVGVWDRETAEPVPVLVLVLLFLYLGPTCSNSAAILIEVERQIQRAIKEVGKDILGLADFLVVFRLLGIQGAEMEVDLFLRAVVGGEFSIFR